MKTINKLITTGVFLSILFVLSLLTPGIAHAQYGYVFHSYASCSGSYLYWYDSNGNQNDVAQYCSNGCSGNFCNNNNYNYNYNNYGNCTYHAYKLCAGNNIYWYDSCQNQQDLAQYCQNGQTCKYGQCTNYIQPVQQYNAYVAHYNVKCYGISLYWYDSLGVFSGLNKDCSDKNSCTIDTCSGNKCANELKCDGSTCAAGSDDYKNYCLPAQTGTTGQTDSTSQPNSNANTNSNTNSNTNASANANGLSVSLFAKQDLNSNQWQKTTQVNSNGKVYFMISAVNNSAAQIDNINISANIPSEISSLGNLQLNGVAVSGDIVSGINIGSLAPASAKSITFEGRTQTISATATKQATATSNVSGSVQSDSISINLSPGQAAAAVSSAPATSGFWGFLQRWYLWIFGAVVLTFLFVVVFKRLSSDA